MSDETPPPPADEPSPADQRVPTPPPPDDNSEAAGGSSLHVVRTARSVREGLIGAVLFSCAALSILTTIGIIIVVLTESVVSFDGAAFFQQVTLGEFFGDSEWTPQFADKHFGIWPLLCGTLMIAGIAGLIGIPIGLASAIYLSEYASNRTRAIVKPALEILAGIPTVVYGYFAVVFVTPYLLKMPLEQWLNLIEVDVFNAASGGIVVGLMIIPMVCSLSEDALRAVPNSLREAGFALGSTKYDVSTKVVVPAAFSGIVASFILALSRAIGETMAVTLAAGSTARLTANPFESVQTMTSYIVNVSMGDAPPGSIAYKSLYAIALSLFVVTLAMNILSQYVMRKFREEYQ